VNFVRKAIIGGGLAAAAFVGGAAGAALLNGAAQAQTSTTTEPASSSSAPGQSSTAPTSGDTTRPAFPAHGTPEHEALEKPVTGDAATQAQAAAVKSVGSGTAGAVTTDVSGKGYEVTVTKADGTQVEVHMDSSFTVSTGGHQGPRGGNDGDADDQPTSTTQG
jgi:hypothetical protein